MSGYGFDDALGVLASLVIEDGRRWGEAATEEQWIDARAVLDSDSPTPYHFVTRARGYSKTADAAGIAIAVMLTELPVASRLYALAADRDQGRLVVDSVEGFAARTPELAGALTVDVFKVTARRSGSTLEVLAADAPSSYGLRPAFLLVDELTQWSTTEGPRRLFDATTSALAKVPGARCLVVTSTGDPSHWSYRVREHARVDPLWRLHEVAGPPPWIDVARLAEQRRRLLPSMFARLFLNVWTTSEDRLATVEDLRAGVTLDGPRERIGGRRYAIGVDLGLKHDRTVAAVCSIDLADAPDEPALTPIDAYRSRLGIPSPPRPVASPAVPGRARVVALDRLGVWSGTRAAPVLLDDVEGWLRKAHEEYGSPSVIVDPWNSAQLAQRLASSGVTVSEYVFSAQSIGRLALRLFQLIADHALALPPDEELIDEIANVRLRETSPGVHRLDHDPDKHDDRAIAVALAATGLLDAPTPARMVAVDPRLRITGDLERMNF